MLAIAIAAFFVTLTFAAVASIAASMAKGIASGRAILAELAGTGLDGQPAAAMAYPPLRSRREVTLPKYSRQAVRLRPLRRCAAAA